VTAEATKETSSKLGVALDGVVAALIAGVAQAFHSRIDGMVDEVVTSIKGDGKARSIGSTRIPADDAIRAD
jgi:hypothetical protein